MNELMLDLTHAVVVSPPDLSTREKKAVAMLLDEVEKRTRLRWPCMADRPAMCVRRCGN